jgi:uncharacterized coiled-coil protein SlyX
VSKVFAVFGCSPVFALSISSFLLVHYSSSRSLTVPRRRYTVATFYYLQPLGYPMIQTAFLLLDYVIIRPKKRRIDRKGCAMATLDERVSALENTVASIQKPSIPGADLPRLEARVGAQERMVTILNARIEELSQDMTASFRELADYQVQTERKMAARFDKIDADMVNIRANMVTKEDMSAMETRILDSFKQLIAMIDTRLPPQ